MGMNKQQYTDLQLIPKATNYAEYMIELIIKLPRTEKFSIGTEYKQSIYEMIRYILYTTKKVGADKIDMLNRIDCELNLQRIFLRIMCKAHWIDTKKFQVAMDKKGEIGRIVGGLMKYYAKNHSQ